MLVMMMVYGYKTWAFPQGSLTSHLMRCRKAYKRCKDADPSEYKTNNFSWDGVISENLCHR